MFTTRSDGVPEAGNECVFREVSVFSLATIKQHNLVHTRNPFQLPDGQKEDLVCRSIEMPGFQLWANQFQPVGEETEAPE